MNVVIAGAGSVGFQIGSQLINEGKDVVLIEANPERAKYASSHLDCIVICGNAHSLEDLKKAGISSADYFISVTRSDEVNMIACALVSSEFSNVKTKIARIRSTEFHDTNLIKNKYLGIDFIINPEIEIAKVISNITAHGAVSNVVHFEKAFFQLRNITITEKSFFVDKSLKEIKDTVLEDFLIVTILRNNEIIIPTGNFIIRKDDSIYIAGSDKSIDKVFKKAGLIKTDVKKIVIVGGGNICRNLLTFLYTEGHKITIIEKNYNICKELSNDFSNALVVNADITDESIYEEELLSTYDLIITITNNEELNILSAIYAKKIGIKRAIALVLNNNYLSLSSHLGIDSVVSPKTSSVDSILRVLRRGNITNVHSLYQGKAEILEFAIDSNSPVVNKLLKNLNLPDNTLIIGITSNGENIIPNGNYEIKINDVVLIITLKNQIENVENTFLSEIV